MSSNNIIVPILKGTVDLSPIKPFAAKPDDKGNTVVKMTVVGSERVNGEFAYPVYLNNTLVGVVESENLGVIPDYVKVIVSLFTNKINNKFVTKANMKIDIVISGRLAKVFQKLTYPEGFTETYEIGEISIDIHEDFKTNDTNEETAGYIDESLPFSRFIV